MLQSMHISYDAAADAEMSGRDVKSFADVMLGEKKIRGENQSWSFGTDGPVLGNRGASARL